MATELETALQQTNDMVSDAFIHMSFGRHEMAIDLLTQAIWQSPDETESYCLLLECFVRTGNKTLFKNWTDVFIRKFGMKDAAWERVKSLRVDLEQAEPSDAPAGPASRSLCLQLFPMEVVANAQANPAGDASTTTPASPEEPHAERGVIRLNLLSAEAEKRRVVAHKLLADEKAYQRACEVKLEERVLERIKELKGIVSKKKLLGVRPQVLDKLETLKSEQPNMAEVAGLVMSHLHAQCVLGRPARIPPILMVGGPGTGKTRFMRKLTEALDLPFSDVPMAGLCDSIKISGLSKYWSTADAGMIAATFAEHAIGNPVFLFDEIDKTGLSDKGNPLDVLLLLLEEESSRHFKDEFLNFALDTSHASILATANSVDHLPAPLLSRFIVIEVPELDTEGRAMMARAVYDELLQSRGYDQVFEPAMQDAAARTCASLGLHGRELKRAIENAMLKQIGSLGYEEVPEEKLSFDPSLLTTATVSNQAGRIGFLR